MEIRFEITAMLYGRGFSPTVALHDLLKKACSRNDASEKINVVSVEQEDNDDIWHITLGGSYEDLHPIFENLYRYFYWKFGENPVLTGRFSKMIL